MRRIIAFLLGGVVFAQAAPAFAQAQDTVNAATANGGNDRRQVVPFLDATYVAFGRAQRRAAGNEPAAVDVAFEGDIVPNFVIHQSFFDVLGEEELERRFGDSEYRFAWSIVGVPMVKLRMFVNEPSAPVRTPSYMPKGTVQFFLFKPAEENVNLFSFQTTVGHHSNGQDGCLFANQTRPPGDPDGDCRPLPPLDRSRVAVNRRDGSFSTNYVQVGMRYRHVVLDPLERPDPGAADRGFLLVREALNRNDRTALAQALRFLLETVHTPTATAYEEAEKALRKVLEGIERDQAFGAIGDERRTEVLQAIDALFHVAGEPDRTSRRDATLGVDLEVNPGNGGFLGGGGIDPELKSRYGANRLTFHAGTAWRLPKGCYRLELKGFAKYIHKPGLDVPSWIGSGEFQCLFRETNWGVFARYYAGQDYYNLGFQDDVRRLQVGMTYSQEGFLRFRARRDD